MTNDGKCPTANIASAELDGCSAAGWVGARLTLKKDGGCVESKDSSGYTTRLGGRAAERQTQGTVDQ